MTGVLGGFAALTAVIAVGWMVGRAGLLGADASGVLARLSFYVATPALLFLTLAGADVSAVLSPALVPTAGSAVLVALAYMALARWRWRLRAPEMATGALSASYVNAGNLGVPVSVYVLGDAAYVAPVLLFQLLVMAPIGLTALGNPGGRAGAPRWWQLVTRPLRTPVVIGSLLGLLAASSEIRLPSVVLAPIELVAGLAVPAALLAYGMSLHGAPRPATGGVAGQVWLAVALKSVGHPLLAYALGRWVADLDGTALLAVTVTSALPTAQNIVVFASAHGHGTVVPRDVILISTALSVPILVAVSLALG